MRPRRNNLNIGMGCNAASGARSPAFSLVEILVSMALMSFIVLGLIMMFNQTQRAFRGSMQQVDLLESGRIVTDMLGRELEQAAPSKAEPVYDLAGNIIYEKVNFFVEPASTFAGPYIQPMPASNLPRTNVVQTFFFMSRTGQEWQGTGYVVLQESGMADDVGTLYRFESVTRPPFVDYDMASSFRTNIAIAINTLSAKPPGAVTNLSRVVDGVIHLRLRSYSKTGEALIAGPSTNLVFRRPSYDPLADLFPVADTFTRPYLSDPSLAGAYFTGKAVPASVELEMGVLEPNIYERYKALEGNAVAKRNYLSNHVANVHIFRTRVPIRNVDTSVYP